MKKNWMWLMALVVLVGMGVSCNKHEGEVKDHNMSDLWFGVVSEYEDSALVEYSDSTKEFFSLILDSMYVMSKSMDVNEVLFSKFISLSLQDMMLGKQMEQERVVALLEKQMKVQFEFQEYENDTLVMLNLVNYFIPKNHDVENGDFFDFYAYLDKNTGECRRMVCIMPTFTDDEEKPGFQALLGTFDIDEEKDCLESFHVERDEEAGCWKAYSDGSDFEKLLHSSMAFLMVRDSDGHESSCINLKYLKEQYERRWWK